jgi:hypothetical protein
MNTNSIQRSTTEFNGKGFNRNRHIHPILNGHDFIHGIYGLPKFNGQFNGHSEKSRED